MQSTLKRLLGICLMTGLAQSASAQFMVSPQVNSSIPVGSIDEYTTPSLGYGLQVGYNVWDSWAVTAAYNEYHLDLTARIDDLNINEDIIEFLNLPETLLFDLQVNSWNGGIRYQVPNLRVAPYFEITASTNQISAEGLGLSLARRYWGVASAVGAEWHITDRWGVQANVRFQAIFTQGDALPLVGELIEDNIFFIPAQLGMVYRFGNLR
ncbi:MAG: outer membrane beta-barrel protein [Bacteroidota bacterium]